MDQRAIIVLEMERKADEGVRKYSFTMPIGAPYGEAYDVAFEILQQITTMSQEAADKAKRPEIKTDTDIVEQSNDDIEVK